MELVKFGVGNTDRILLPNNIRWSEVRLLAFTHGLGAIVLDSIQKCYNMGIPCTIGLQEKLEWIGGTSAQEQEYKRQEKNIASLAQFFGEQNIKMMVLKGWGVSLNYPMPAHRPCSDLDIYLFGEQKRGDELITERLNIAIDNGHHHHTVFVYKGLTVENHYDFLNVYSHRSNKTIEKWLKELARSEYKVTKVLSGEVYLPSANFNALFLLRHMAVEFAATGMNLRQVLDWGLFVKSYQNEVDWPQLLGRVKQMNMYKFLDAVNYICYTCLGFQEELFHGFGDTSYGERVLADLFATGNNPKENGTINYLCGRMKNWLHSRWKHRIVYSDSLFSTFVYQVVAHLMKPATLHH